MKHKYNIGDILKIKFHKEIKYAVIINEKFIDSDSAGSFIYEYIIQGLEGQKYWDSEYNLELRIKEATYERKK
jgi:hypothetical protein